jgi:hypothetical protein
MKKKSALQKKKDNPRSKYWQTKADDLWKLIIHDRQVCAVNNEGCSSKLEAHHLITRANKVTRHRIENGVLLCCNHHKFCTKLSAHKAPLAFSEWLQENDPDTWEWCSRNKFKVGTYDYEAAYGLLLEYCTESHIDV